MRNLTIAIVCLMGSMCLIGCGSQDPGRAADADRLTVAVIPKCTTSEFWDTVKEGARQAAEEYGVEMRWDGALSESDIAGQNSTIDNMISAEVDGIALAPLNEIATRKKVEAATEAEIPVVIFDSAVEGDAHVSFVATNNEQGGALAGRHMIELLGDGLQEVVVFRFVEGTASTEERAKGFIDTVTASGLQVVADPYAESDDVAGCKKTALNTLERYIRDDKLELAGIFCCNDRASMGTVGALDDIRDSGVEVNVKCIGFDFPDKLVKSLQAGEVDAIIAQDPKRMGYLAVETLVKHIRGETVPEFIDTGVQLVTREALAKDAALRKLVGADE